VPNGKTKPWPCWRTLVFEPTAAAQQLTSRPVRRLKAERWLVSWIAVWFLVSSTAVN
jgi:hypothetical protein